MSEPMMRMQAWSRHRLALSDHRELSAFLEQS